MQWWILLLLLGVSFTLWMALGAVRLVAENAPDVESAGEGEPPPRLSVGDVAVVIPAHNEELAVGATIASVLRGVPTGNVHVVADGCDDGTAGLASAYGVNVLVLDPSRGKAGAIETALHHYELPERFAVLLIVDADTELDEHYIERGLRLLDDPEMVALAGYAHTKWRPRELSMTGRFLVAYRTRLYAVMQWMKYGQTWRHTNVTAIVPGFASMYRTAVLPRMDLNPPGLVIEDFNMTFEVHHKRLGKIAFRPSVFGRTQDPDNLPDYYRQIKRWWLGLWQTLRRHKFWPSGFSAALALFLLEVLLASVIIILVALAVLLLALFTLTGGLALQWDWYASFYATVAPFLTPTNLLLFLFVPDYLLTCAVAIWMRRPSLLVYGLGFLLIRLIDATATLWTLPQAWWARSTGRWDSPGRRAVDVPRDTRPRPGAAAPDTSLAGRPAPPGTATHDASIREAPASDVTYRPARSADRLPVLRDAVVVVGALLLAAAVVVALAVPVTALLAGSIVAVASAAVWSHRGR